METLKFQAQFASLEKISQVVERAAQGAGLDDSAVYAIQLAVDEACTNIIQHAYGGEGRGEIYLTPLITDQGLTIILRDFGASFDPQSVPVPDLSRPIEELQPNGLGLYWMRKLVDEARFEFSERDGNTLTLVKRK